MARRQLTAFLPAPFGEQVDKIRTRWDPEMARRIAAHVTVIHDLDGDAAYRSGLDLAASRPELTVRLTHAQCWGSPEAGIYLGVEDTHGDLARIGRELMVTEAPDISYEPHVTLVHPRTTMATGSQEAWGHLASWSIDETVALRDVSVIELQGPKWLVVTRRPSTE